MTNAEKYLKDGIDEEEFIKELHLFWWANQYDVCDGIRKFLNAEAKKKTPTLTEDERVILRNINTNNYDKVGRKISGALYLGIVNEIGIDSTFEDFFQDSDLFQFIKERRRIRDKGVIK